MNPKAKMYDAKRPATGFNAGGRLRRRVDR